MPDEKPNGTTFQDSLKDGPPGQQPHNGLAKAGAWALRSAVRSDETLFDSHREREQPRRYAIYGVASIAAGAAVYELARLTGIVLPEYVGIPLAFMASLLTWKASKPVLRWFLRRNPRTPAEWQQMSDQEIVSYARRRLGDLAGIEQHRGWKDIYAQLGMVPEQLPALLAPWRKANRDRERLEERKKVYAGNENAHLAHARVSLEEAIAATQKRADELAGIIWQRLASFDTVDAWFSKAQHTSGSDAAAIEAAIESIRKINEDADSMLQGIAAADEVTDPPPEDLHEPIT